MLSVLILCICSCGRDLSGSYSRIKGGCFTPVHLEKVDDATYSISISNGEKINGTLQENLIRTGSMHHPSLRFNRDFSILYIGKCMYQLDREP